MPVEFLDGGLDDGSPRWQRWAQALPQRFQPRALGRNERCLRVFGEFDRWVCDLRMDQFCPDRGASGRPRTGREITAGPPGSARAQTPLSRTLAGQTSVTWENGTLTVTGHTRGRYPFARADLTVSTVLAGPAGEPAGRRREVAELVWFESKPDRYTKGVRKVSLHLLDTQGYCLLTLTPVHFAWSSIAKVARAAGIPAAGYSIRCPPERADRIRKLLFPHGKGHKTVRG